MSFPFIRHQIWTQSKLIDRLLVGQGLEADLKPDSFGNNRPMTEPARGAGSVIVKGF